MAGHDNDVIVEIKTELGDFSLQVFCDIAPISATNFLRYVDGGHLDGQSVFRIVTLDNDPKGAFPVQALHWGRVSTKEKVDQPFPNIPHEPTTVTGLTHKKGTLSMARYEPGYSGSSFFICMRDEPEFDFGGKRNPDGQGFSAFGEVVDGWETCLKLFARAEAQPWLVNPIPIYSARRRG